MLPCSFILSRLWRAHNVRPYKQWCCSSVGANAGIGPQCCRITHHRGRAKTALPLWVDRYFGFRSQASRFNVDAIARLSPPPAPAGAPSQRGPFFQASSRFYSLPLGDRLPRYGGGGTKCQKGSGGAKRRRERLCLYNPSISNQVLPFFFLVLISTPTPPTTSSAPMPLNSRVPKPPVVGRSKPFLL